MILEDLRVNRRAVCLTKMFSQFHLAMNRAVPPDKPSREADDDQRWLRRTDRTTNRRNRRELFIWRRPLGRQNLTFGLEIGCIGWRRSSNTRITGKALASTPRRSRDGKKNSSKNNRPRHERTSVLKALTGLERTHRTFGTWREDPSAGQLASLRHCGFFGESAMSHTPHSMA